MEKKTILWLLAVLVIGAFVLEFFVVIMFTPPQQREETVPTPTPGPKQFTGIGYAKAVVVGFGDDALVECNTTDSRAADALAGVEGVKNAFFAAGAVIVVKLNQSFSSEEFAGVASEMNSTLSQWCAPKIVRSAAIRLEEPLMVFDRLNNSETIYPRDLETHAFYLGQRAPTAFVLPGVVENESIDLLARVFLQEGRVAQFLAQQVSAEAGAPGAENESASNESGGSR